MDLSTCDLGFRAPANIRYRVEEPSFISIDRNVPAERDEVVELYYRQLCRELPAAGGDTFAVNNAAVHGSDAAAAAVYGSDAAAAAFYGSDTAAVYGSDAAAAAVYGSDAAAAAVYGSDAAVYGSDAALYGSAAFNNSSDVGAACAYGLGAADDEHLYRLPPRLRRRSRTHVGEVPIDCDPYAPPTNSLKSTFEESAVLALNRSWSSQLSPGTNSDVQTRLADFEAQYHAALLRLSGSAMHPKLVKTIIDTTAELKEIAREIVRRNNRFGFGMIYYTTSKINHRILKLFERAEARIGDLLSL